MIVICEECGKKYRIDPAKIKGETARFRCKSCNNMITVKKPVAEPEQPEPPLLEPMSEEPSEERAPVPEPKAKAKGPKPSPKPRRIGLRGKMFVFFFLVPIILITAAGALYLLQLNDLSSLITKESSKMVTKMAENAIIENARSVAKQVKLYLSSHLELKKEGFNHDTAFKKVAIQKVGMTGYSCIYSIPDENGLSSLWAHPNPKLIGVDVPKIMRKPLGKEYHRWWGVYKGAYKGKESKGYYTWEDADGRLREKYMVCTPVAGTPYVVASTTYLDEFTRPAELLEKRAMKIVARTRITVFGILAASLVLTALIVAIYGQMVTGKIKYLTDVADRISVGELDAEVETKSKDEIGDLAEAIGRMQDSIRLSIERLRRRR